MVFSSVYKSSLYGLIGYGIRSAANYSANLSEALTSVDLLRNSFNCNGAIIESISLYNYWASYIYEERNLFTSDDNRNTLVEQEKRTGKSESVRSSVIKSDTRTGVNNENRSASVIDNRTFNKR